MQRQARFPPLLCRAPRRRTADKPPFQLPPWILCSVEPSACAGRLHHFPHFPNSAMACAPARATMARSPAAIGSAATSDRDRSRADAHRPAWTRYSCGSTVRRTTSGGRLITKARCSRSSPPATSSSGTVRPRWPNGANWRPERAVYRPFGDKSAFV